MDDETVDVLIVGGGLIGASLMVLLSGLGCKVRLVETQPLATREVDAADARSLTLSPASAKILQMMSIWSLVEKHITPIKTIHISEQRRFGHSKISGSDAEPLGYVIDIQALAKALYQRIDPKNLIIPGRLTAFDPVSRVATLQQGEAVITQRVGLLVAADGADSSVRQLLGLSAEIFDYRQQALVANIDLARPHHHCAYERFTLTGPMAVLPRQGLRVGLVWAQPPFEAARLKNLPETEFLKTLQREFGYRLGRFLGVGQRAIYPLRQVLMPKQVVKSVVFIGNAAHTLHPVAGQGFNLGLRDVATLAQYIAAEGLDESMLQHYAASRQKDQHAISDFTDKLVKLFSSELPGLASLRSAGLILFDNFPPFKKILGRYTRGYAGTPADLICGIPLDKKRDNDESDL